MRQWSGAAFGTRGVWLQAVLRSARDAGTMALDDYSEALAKLAAFHHAHLSIDVETLLSAYEQDTLRERYRLRALCRYIGNRGADPGSHIPVAAGFVNEIWARRPWPDLKFKIATDTMFEAILSRYRGADRDSWAANLARALAPRPRVYLDEWRRGQLLLLPPPGR